MADRRGGDDTLRFGATRITSVMASDDNPRKIGTFVEIVYIPRGRTNAGKHYRCTDEQGNFWLVPVHNAAIDLMAELERSLDA